MAEVSLVEMETKSVPIKEHQVADLPIFELPTQMRTVYEVFIDTNYVF